jgi:hypothetical protein
MLLRALRCAGAFGLGLFMSDVFAYCTIRDCSGVVITLFLLNTKHDLKK